MEKGTVEHRKPDDVEEAFELLLKSASARPEPSEEMRREVRRALHDEWCAQTARRRRWRNAAGLSLAAAAGLVLALALWRGGEPGTQPVMRELAMIERVSGAVRVMSGDPAVPGTSAASGAPVYSGQSLLTGPGEGVSLRLQNGLSLRVDETTELTLIDEFAAELRNGRVYVDTESVDISAPTAPGSRLQLFTPLGAVSHVGTQYLVLVKPGSLEVSVRRGSASLASSGSLATKPLYIQPGQKLMVDQSGRHEIAQAEPDDPEWRWAEALSPGFDLEGKTLVEFLDWVSSETGLDVSYASDDIRTMAQSTVLHGRADLPAREALEVVMLSSDLQAVLEEGIISIKARP